MSLRSDSAISRQKHARRHYDLERDADARRMKEGPYLDEDGCTVVIPGGPEYYNRDAARFWRQQGFVWDGDAYVWTRDTQIPLRGATYTADGWLAATRRRFYEFWPQEEEATDV